MQIALKGIAVSSALHLDLFVVRYKPIIGLIPPWGGRGDLAGHLCLVEHRRA